MSGMYTMLPLTQVLRAGERRENDGRKARPERQNGLFHKNQTGAADVAAGVQGVTTLQRNILYTYIHYVNVEMLYIHTHICQQLPCRRACMPVNVSRFETTSSA